MTFGDGLIIIMTITDLVRILAIGVAAPAIERAIMGLRAIGHDDGEAHADQLRCDPA